MSLNILLHSDQVSDSLSGSDEIVILNSSSRVVISFPQDATKKPKSDIEEYVRSSHKPWTPTPILSMHVRMGDKACEMKLAEFEDYMLLVDRIRQRFPHLDSIWLSTKMQVCVFLVKGN